MTHGDIAPRGWRFDPNGDCMQAAERVKVWKSGELVQDYFVMRNRDGIYCGRDLILFPEKI
jgi:hypothetical protein